MGKSRRGGLAERWLRRSDVDSEMWPEESFGGVTDEQFWDDIAADKPLATTARTAQDSSARPRPDGARGPGGRRLPALPAPPSAPAPVPAPVADRAPAAASAAATQAFHVTGPQPVQPAGPQAAGPQPYQATGAQSFQTTGPQPYLPTGPQPAASPPVSGPPTPTAQPYGGRAALPSRPAPAVSAPATGAHAAGAHTTGAHAAPAHGTHGTSASVSAAPASAGYTRPAAGEDPLTSDAFSLRSRGAVDGRSYQAARRPRDLSREQYEAAIGQETQTFSMIDAPPATGGYPAISAGTGSYQAPSSTYPVAIPPSQPYDAQGNGQSRGPRAGRHRDEDRATGAYALPPGGSYASGPAPYPYGQSGPAPLSQTPPYGYGADSGYGPAESGYGPAESGYGPDSGYDPGYADNGYGSADSSYDYTLGDYPNTGDQLPQRDYGRPPAPASGRGRDGQGWGEQDRGDRGYQNRYPAPYDPHRR